MIRLLLVIIGIIALSAPVSLAVYHAVHCIRQERRRQISDERMRRFQEMCDEHKGRE